MEQNKNLNIEQLINFYNAFKDSYDILDDLCKRIQDDYNCVERFKQMEEDRGVLSYLLDMFEEIDK